MTWFTIMDLAVCLGVRCYDLDMIECKGEDRRLQCISRYWTCDGRDDCGNNWDESDCGQFVYHTIFMTTRPSGPLGAALRPPLPGSGLVNR